MDENATVLIDLDQVIKSKSPSLYKKIPRFLINYLKRKIHQDEINYLLTTYGHQDGVDFMQSLVKYFNIELKVEGLDKLANDGRFIFASNHPLGGLDGICLAAIIGVKYDKKVKYIVNDLLMNLKPLQDIFVPVNKHGQQSKASIEAQVAAFDSDNQIITFPAGLCSRKQNGVVRDLLWRKSFITKAIETKRDVVPVYFEGRNSNFFYSLANIRKKLGIKFNLEMLFLPSEMFKSKNKTYTISFGKPIKYTFFDDTKSVIKWADYVKREVYKMSER